tara:strand:+ start:1100 stop:1363 length:264 start_codon:yes stop_codon:yes gene_type:complete
MWEIILAVYLSGLLMALFKLWLPIYQKAKSVAPKSLVARYPLTVFITVLFMFAVSWPMVIWASLNDEYSENFINAFLDGAITKNERQ